MICASIRGLVMICASIRGSLSVCTHRHSPGGPDM